MPLARQGRWALLLMLLGAGAVGAARACEAPPAGPSDLRIPGYYSDKAGSVIDPALLRENRSAAEVPDRYAARITGWSDDFLRSGDPAHAQCALQWLAGWARDGALLGRMQRVNNDQSEYMRQWLLDAAAMSYLKLRGQADAAQREAIEAWLRSLAQANLRYWDDPRHKRNNHYDWTGVGVLATALATGDAALWRTGHAIYRSGVRDIAADGSLPMEMARRSRALHYHDYALSPLVMMAELARLRGEDWYGENHHAIDRLARRVAQGYADPSWFAAHAGVAQEPPKVSGSTGWVDFYRLRAPDPDVFAALSAQGPFREPRLGGDLTLMAAHGIVRDAPAAPGARRSDTQGSRAQPGPSE